MALNRFSIPCAIAAVLLGLGSTAGAGSLRFGSNTIFLPGTGTPIDNGIALAEVVAEVNVSLPSDARWTIELGPGHVRDAMVTTAGNDGIEVLFGGSQGAVFEGVVVEAVDVAIDFGMDATGSLRDCRLVSETFDVLQVSSGEDSIEGSTLEAGSSSPVLRLFGGTIVVRRSSLILNGGPYAQGTSGALEMTQTYVSDGATADLTGTATGTCSATSGDGTFSATTCP